MCCAAASVVSILISSDFLGMESLVAECLDYIRDRINEIVKMPIDLNCLSVKLLDRLATLVSSLPTG